MGRVSDLLGDIDTLVQKYTVIETLNQENKDLKAKLTWAIQCFKQALEVLGHGEEDSRVAYLESRFENYFEK